MRRLVAIALFIAAFCGVELRRETGGEMPSGLSLWGVSSPAFPGLGMPGASASQARRWPGPFRVEVLDVLDGDTVEVRFVDGPCGRGPCPGQVLAVRFANVDAPEAHRCRTSAAGRSGGQSCAACAAEHRLGQDALAFTRRLVEGRAWRVSAARPDKFHGRIVGDLQILDGGAWRSVGAALVEAGLAVPYDGRRKNKPWCDRTPD